MALREDVARWKREKRQRRERYWMAMARAKGLSFREIMRRIKANKKGA